MTWQGGQMTMRPRLYLDVDGVLFGLYDGHFQLRPNVVGFLSHCIQHFDCSWLTCWSSEGLRQLLRWSYGSNLAGAIQYTAWAQSKASAIDLASDFYWIEDGILAEEWALLQAHGVDDRFILASPFGSDELTYLWTTLLWRAQLCQGEGAG